jgi:membrane glycosyltransferase
MAVSAPPFHADPLTARRMTRRRLILLTLVLFPTAVASLMTADLLWGMPLAGWSAVLWILFVVLFAHLAFGAAQALIGFVVRRRRGDPCRLSRSLPPAEEAGVPLAPTAVVFPIHNEDVQRVYAGLRAVYRSLARTGQLDHFDFYILSDSTSTDRWIEEEIAWVELSRELGARGRIFYRKRRVNSNRKAGNIADFCRRWGRLYRYLIVLDADSVMAGGTLVRLVRLMERNDGVGLIQTAPILVRGETLFARVFAFASRLYSPIFLAGANYWQQGEANYWGHNAIIRLAPFIEHCALPELPGREPFGGKIMSHDFVEAALLRRAGWSVWLAHDLGGSYEEGPPTLIAAAKRDRRWCQGNLQHFWLLFARELKGISRVHLFLGIFGYAASVLWLLSLVLGSLLVIGFTLTRLSWLPESGFAEAIGLGANGERALLVAMTVVLLFGPKLLALGDLLLQPESGRGFGGFARVCLGAMAECFFSVLLAPISMFFHAKFVLMTLRGKGVRWSTQQRSSDEGTGWREAIFTHGMQTLVGVAWALALVWLARNLLGWMAPVLAGLLLAIPFSIATSRRWPRLAGLFCTPEERDPPEELRELDAVLTQPSAPHARLPELEIDRGLMRVVVDPYINALHRCLLRERSGRSGEIVRYFEAAQEKLLREGPAALEARDKLALMSDADSIDWLHRQMWLRPSAEIAPWWRLALRHYPSLLDGK